MSSSSEEAVKGRPVREAIERMADNKVGTMVWRTLIGLLSAASTALIGLLVAAVWSQGAVVAGISANLDGLNKWVTSLAPTIKIDHDTLTGEGVSVKDLGTNVDQLGTRFDKMETRIEGDEGLLHQLGLKESTLACQVRPRDCRVQQ